MHVFSAADDSRLVGAPDAGARFARSGTRAASFALALPMLLCSDMSGYITERDFETAETEFPGIVALYHAMEPAPPTFLDLLRAYLERCDAVGETLP
jgi:hypothetical protein